MAVGSAWYLSRIERTQEMIIIYEDAIAAIGGGAQAYTLDTGQTRQQVTKAQMSQMKNTLSMLENRLATLCAKVYGAAVICRPGF